MAIDRPVDGALTRTLVVTDLVDSTPLTQSGGDERAAGIFARVDRIPRDLVADHNGREIDRTDGFLLVFEEPTDGLRFSLAYHEALLDLSAEQRVSLASRAGIHVGPSILRENEPDDVERGAKRFELEGLAKPVAARVAGLAGARQTLLTEAAWSAVEQEARGSGDWLREGIRWKDHGQYELKGLDDPVRVHEIGVAGQAPLRAPADSDKARRVAAEASAPGRPAWPASSLAIGVVVLLAIGAVVAIVAWPRGDQVRTGPLPTSEPAASPDARAAEASPEVLRHRCLEQSNGDPSDSFYCTGDNVAWCDAQERRIACCGNGLVPFGEEGLCDCPPGGTTDEVLIRRGCKAFELDGDARRERVRSTIDSVIPRIKQCYQEPLSASPGLEGTVTVRLDLTPEGRVFDVKLQSSSLPSVEAQSCFLGVLRTLRFEPPAGGSAVINYPLMFGHR